MALGVALFDAEAAPVAVFPVVVVNERPREIAVDRHATAGSMQGAGASRGTVTMTLGINGARQVLVQVCEPRLRGGDVFRP
jgi:hypothetical protein